MDRDLKKQVITCMIDKSFCQSYYSIMKSCVWLVLLKDSILVIQCKSSLVVSRETG